MCVIAGVWIFSGPILRGIGSRLVKDGPPVAADIIVVLAGDDSGQRILKGAELARQGFAPSVMADSSELDYGHSESDLAADFAIQHGYSPGLFVRVGWKATSTVEEAGHVVRELRRRGVHKVMVVTTLWHTARAGRIFRRIAPDLEIHMVGVDDPAWHNGNWWVEREGRKRFFLESVKTIANYLGM